MKAATLVARSLWLRGADAARRVAAIADGRKRLVVDGDRGCGILGDVAVVGDGHGNGFADIADLVAGERMLGAQRRDRGIGHRHRQRLGREPSRHVGCGEHRMDAGHGQCRCRVDRADAGMGVRAAHEGRMQRARQLHVVDKARPPGEQSRIFDPWHAGAELPRAHDSSLRALVGGDIGGKTGGRSGNSSRVPGRLGREAPLLDAIAGCVKHRGRLKSPANPSIWPGVARPALVTQWCYKNGNPGGATWQPIQAPVRQISFLLRKGEGACPELPPRCWSHPWR